MPGVEFPTWLRQEFAARGAHDARLVRIGSCRVWESESRQLLAKVYQASDADTAHREASIAEVAVRAGIPTPEPLDVTVRPEGAVTWWRRIAGTVPHDDPLHAARLLRRLHDEVAIDALPRLEPFLPDAPLPPGDARQLQHALSPMRDDAMTAWASLQSLPLALCHGDPNPTNLLRDTDGTLVLLDFGNSGVGPRVLDVAALAVLGAETGAADADDIASAYGNHPDVTPRLLATAARIVAYQRAHACTRTYGWLSEGHERLEAWQRGEPYRFATGEHPK